jgi:nucleoside triphosphate pyrophosphatase
VIANAHAKAAAVRERVGEGAVVLGADTEVALDGGVLGKPSGPGEARALLTRLSGREHEVLSGLVALGPGAGDERAGIERTAVRFAELSQAQIERYVASGEWRDRAGAYAVQGLGSMFVEKVEGDLSNVIGMPISLFAQLLPDFLGKP